MTEKLKHRVEYEKDGPLQVVRIHRQFFGRQAVKEPLLIEIEYEENESLYGAADVDDSLGTLGRSVRVEKVPGLVITPDPGLYGGTVPFVELKFGEWNVLNLHEL